MDRWMKLFFNKLCMAPQNSQVFKREDSSDVQKIGKEQAVTIWKDMVKTY